MLCFDSNGGVYGSLMSTPILNPPQSGILGMHKIERRPIAVGDKVEIRPMITSPSPTTTASSTVVKR